MKKIFKEFQSAKGPRVISIKHLKQYRESFMNSNRYLSSDQSETKHYLTTCQLYWTFFFLNYFKYLFKQFLY